jgi:hypothetical protein
MTAEQARPGTRVRVMEHHRVEGRRGLVGTVVDRYGGEEYVAVDVRLADGQLRLFWPRDLEEVSRLRHGGASGSVERLRVDSGSIHRSTWRRHPQKFCTAPVLVT